ncbi:MAG: SAM-dependent methyltransferase [Bdellovibrionota bacterium]
MKKNEDANEISQLWPGQSMDLLKSLHILTRDGRLNQDSRRKLKQVQHLVQLITPHLEGLGTFADLGAGKSYLGFMLYDLWLREHDETRLYAIEQRKELIDACKLIASRSSFDRISFVPQSIVDASEASDLPEEIDVVTALHACDTATDEAIAFALKKNAKLIALVPCCQAEVARLLDEVPGREAQELQNLWRHGIHRREFGSHLTNVIRSLFLESQGYKVRVTELIGWEHSMKNELILAEKIQRSNTQAKNQLDSLMKRFPVAMRLFELTREA